LKAAYQVVRRTEKGKNPLSREELPEYLKLFFLSTEQLMLGQPHTGVSTPIWAGYCGLLSVSHDWLHQILAIQHFENIAAATEQAEPSVLFDLIRMISWLYQTENVILRPQVNVKVVAEILNDYEGRRQGVIAALFLVGTNITSPHKAKLYSLIKELLNDSRSIEPWDIGLYKLVVDPRNIGTSGGAADAEGARSGMLVRGLDKRLPLVVTQEHSRYSTIAALLTFIGHKISRQAVRGILLRGQT